MRDYVYIVDHYNYDNPDVTYGTEFVTYNYIQAYDFIHQKALSTNLTVEGEVISDDFSLIYTNKNVYAITKFFIE